MLSGPKLKEKGKKIAEMWREKNDICQPVSFVAILLAVHLLFFPSLKKTAGWHVVHLSLKALGHKCMDEQVVDLSVWQWIGLCLDTR